MNARQEQALVRLRQAALAVLPDLSSGPGSRNADVRMGLAELERNHFAYSRLRTIAGALRNLAEDLDSPGTGSGSSAARDLAHAATEALEAFQAS